MSDVRLPDRTGGGPVRDECEALEEVLCAYADGEATPTEADRIRQHIAQCESCEAVLRDYQIIDESLVVSPALPSTLDADGPTFAAAFNNVESPTPLDHQQGHRAGNRSDGLRWASWARRIAAVLLAGVGIGLLVVLPGSNANAARVVRSAATVEVLQDQERSSQEKLRRTLEWELRALRLEVGLLAPQNDAPTDDSAVAVREKIDRLLAHCVALKMQD